MKVLTGIYKKDSGTITYEGKEVEFANPRDAQAAGVVIVHQELNMMNHLTVAQTEAYIEARLTPPPPRKKKPTFILKDVRLFLNTVTKGLSMMKDAGVNAEYGRQETEDAILLTIKIPKAAS